MSWGLSSITSTDIAEIEGFLGCQVSDIAMDKSHGGANICLDILEAMWTVQALKERDFDMWFTALRKRHSEEVHDVSIMIGECRYDYGCCSGGDVQSNFRNRENLKFRRFNSQDRGD